MKIQLRMKNEDGEKGKVLMKNSFRCRDFPSSLEFTDRHGDKPVKTFNLFHDNFEQIIIVKWKSRSSRCINDYLPS